jgi:hypothetical protein
MECLPLWPTYIGEKRRTFGKEYGIKVRCYWEHPLGTHWEHIVKLIQKPLRTWWEQRKNEKKILPPQPFPQNFTIKALWVHVEPSHWLHEISKTIHHHFWLGLIPHYKLGVLIYLFIYSHQETLGNVPISPPCWEQKPLGDNLLKDKF